MPPPHLERAINSVTGRPIYIECDCPLGSDHTFEDWLEGFERRLRFQM